MSSGGGFMVEPNSQGMNSPAKGRSMSSAQSLRSLTIKQLQEAESHDSRIIIDGQELAQVSVIGCVRSIKENATGLDYIIEDGTSSIAARCWPDKHFSLVKEGEWVNIIGNLKIMSNNRNVNVVNIRKITDFNEVTFHFLESIAGHTVNTIGSSFMKSASKTSPLQQSTTSYFEDQSLTPIQRAVFSFYRDSKDEIGVNVSAVIRALNGRYSENDVRNAVSSLVSEGLIYLTIDSDHARYVASC